MAIVSQANPALDLYKGGQQYGADSWLISDWAAGQSGVMQWSPDNVRVAADGDIELVLGRASHGSGRPFQGGEIQSAEVATTGTWSWTAQAPEMVPGAVFGMFTYSADWKSQPWVEFDFEFVGGDTTKVQLNIHMIDKSGQHVTLDHGGRKSNIVDLGFDASKAAHTYEVTVTDKKATFYVDGKVVGEFSGADMPGGVWNIGPMNSYVDLWAVAPAQHEWAGVWTDPGRPLVATISAGEVRGGEYGSSYVGGAVPEVTAPHAPVVAAPEPPVEPAAPPAGSIVGSARNDVLNGSNGNDTIYGLAGNDTIDGRGGSDEMHGGTGDDVYYVDRASDRTVERAGGGYDTTHTTVDWTLADNVEAMFLRSAASIKGTGNASDNYISGNSGSNIIKGLAGNDVLEGNGGNDTLYGDSGADRLTGGSGTDVLFGGDDLSCDTFVFGSTSESRVGRGHDVVHDFVSGIDRLDLSGIDANTWASGNQDFAYAGTKAAAHSVWAVKAGADLLVQGDVNGDGRADFEILLTDIRTLTGSDFIL
ncbi:family 16 glycosylhydrolase [Paracoccus sp. (in: a-proteobacteria)]|uniref:family 16 glycosylhydrolase n=1 Tax=Paracoccus sp. TaxID=267 RepID=UPI00396CF4D5